MQETFTFWTASPNGYGGYTYGNPTVVKGRWEDKTEQFISATGKETISKAIAYIDRSVTVGGFLFRGLATDTDPTEIGANIIQRIDSSRDLRNVKTVRKVYM